MSLLSPKVYRQRPVTRWSSVLAFGVSGGKTEGTAQCSPLYSVVTLVVSCDQTEVTALGSALYSVVTLAVSCDQTEVTARCSAFIVLSL